MQPSLRNYDKLLKTIEKGKIKKTPKNLKIHENWKQTAFKNFEKSKNPKVKSAWGKKFSTLRKTWRSCFTSLKYNPAALDVWELYGDTSYELGMPDITIEIYQKTLEFYSENEDQIRTKMSNAIPDIAIALYQKTLEFYSENEDQIRKKMSHAIKMRDLYDAMEIGRIPLDIEYRLLKCLNCGVSGRLFPYRDINTYKVPDAYGHLHKVTSDITVPLCKSCYSSFNARKNLKYGYTGAIIKVKGSPRGISLNYWKRHVILEKYKAGLLDDAMFSALRVEKILPKEEKISIENRTKLLSTHEGTLEWIRIQYYDLEKSIQAIADDLGESMIRVEKYLREIEK